jgi:hypothetical protein
MDALTQILSSENLYHSYHLLFRTFVAWPPGQALALAVAIPTLLLLLENAAAPAGTRRWRRLPVGAALHASVAAAAFVVSGPALALYAALVWAMARLLGPVWRLGRHGFLRGLPVMAGFAIAASAILLLLPVGFHLLLLSHETLEIPDPEAAIERLRLLLLPLPPL